MSDASGEFAADRAGLADAIARLDRASQDFAAVTRAYGVTACSSPAAFGQFGVAGAWSAFDGAWAAELRQTGAALAELIHDVRAAAGDYRRSDTRAARRVSAA